MQRSVKRCTIPTIGPRWPTLHDSGRVGCNRRIFPRFPVEKGPNLVHHRARRTPHRGRKTRSKGTGTLVAAAHATWIMSANRGCCAGVSTVTHKCHFGIIDRNEVLGRTVSTTRREYPGSFPGSRACTARGRGGSVRLFTGPGGGYNSHRRGALPVDFDRPGCSRVDSPDSSDAASRCRLGDVQCRQAPPVVGGRIVVDLFGKGRCMSTSRIKPFSLTNSVLIGLLFVAVVTVTAPTWAQPTSGEPGSPAATTTIDGRQLPAPTEIRWRDPGQCPAIESVVGTASVPPRARPTFCSS